MDHKLKGHWSTKRVWLDGIEIDPYPSQLIYKHSPEGFNWGYGGSGPAQLALAISLELFPAPIAIRLYQYLKCKVIAKLPKRDVHVKVTLPDDIEQLALNFSPDISEISFNPGQNPAAAGP